MHEWTPLNFAAAQGCARCDSPIELCALFYTARNAPAAHCPGRPCRRIPSRCGERSSVGNRVVHPEKILSRIIQNAVKLRAMVLLIMHQVAVRIPWLWILIVEIEMSLIAIVFEAETGLAAAIGS
eukprot:SAG31_NODE_24404_length_482_cov_0.913838_1_plen_125_part_00